MKTGIRHEAIGNRKKCKLFRIALCALFLALCVAAEAQQVKKVPRIGYLSARPAEMEKILLPAFVQALRKLGYTEGKNIVMEQRYAAAGQSERLRDLAAELVRLKVDVIVASGAHEAAKGATRTIPVVFVVSADPVGEGLVESLARPGGNVTGLSDFHGHLVSKRLELIKEVVPSAARIGFLWNSASSAGHLQFKELQGVAPPLRLTLLSFEVKGPDDFERAFVAIGKERPGALIVQGNPLLANRRREIFALAIKNRVPAIYTHEQWTTTGGLVSYGAHFPDLWRRAASYVDKILNGTKPADLPVEQPTKFELVINLKAAKQIGLTVPPNVLARADRVIK
ncbi:MAG: ABC transporter substrate-binding protein [Deltaproteobacteria bacterium]|nr:ABC transporter substrate-binding protein [Deltaproteobacteria bacterium]